MSSRSLELMKEKYEFGSVSYLSYKISHEELISSVTLIHHSIIILLRTCNVPDILITLEMFYVNPHHYPMKYSSLIVELCHIWLDGVVQCIVYATISLAPIRSISHLNILSQRERLRNLSKVT